METLTGWDSVQNCSDQINVPSHTHCILLHVPHECRKTECNTSNDSRNHADRNLHVDVRAHVLCLKHSGGSAVYFSCNESTDIEPAPCVYVPGREVVNCKQNTHISQFSAFDCFRTNLKSVPQGKFDYLYIYLSIYISIYDYILPQRHSGLESSRGSAWMVPDSSIRKSTS